MLPFQSGINIYGLKNTNQGKELSKKSKWVENASKWYMDLPMVHCTSLTQYLYLKRIIIDYVKEVIFNLSGHKHRIRQTVTMEIIH